MQIYDIHGLFMRYIVITTIIRSNSNPLSDSSDPGHQAVNFTPAGSRSCVCPVKPRRKPAEVYEFISSGAPDLLSKLQKQLRG